MHATSFENMRRCKATYVDAQFLALRPTVSVVEVGSSDVNGSYRPIFPAPRFAYLGLDIAAGPGVDVVLEDPYRLPLPDGSADIVLSGQMFEHCEFFWLSFREMVRVLKEDGFLFLIAPSAGPVHRFPVDCYRFHPDAFRALARFAGCHLVDVWEDDRGPWNDVTGVFSTREQPSRIRLAGSPLTDELELSAPPPAPGTSVEEEVRGATPSLELLSQLHDKLRPALYVEIGVRRGDSLARARGRAVAIDPRPDPSLVVPPGARVHETTSDEFFDSPAATELGRKVELAFIDGMHLAEFALRDFIHLERHAPPWGVIAIDDIFPNHPIQALRRRRTRVWTGDVWRMLECLERHRPDLLVVRVSTSPAGLALIAGLDSDSRTLRDNYNLIMSELRAGEASAPSVDVLSRTGAFAPDSRRLASLVATLASLGTERAPIGRVRAVLAAWKEGHLR